MNGRVTTANSWDSSRSIRFDSPTTNIRKSNATKSIRLPPPHLFPRRRSLPALTRRSCNRSDDVGKSIREYRTVCAIAAAALDVQAIISHGHPAQRWQATQPIQLITRLSMSHRATESISYIRLLVVYLIDQSDSAGYMATLRAVNAAYHHHPSLAPENSSTAATRSRVSRSHRYTPTSCLDLTIHHSAAAQFNRL